MKPASIMLTLAQALRAPTPETCDPLRLPPLRSRFFMIAFPLGGTTEISGCRCGSLSVGLPYVKPNAVQWPFGCRRGSASGHARAAPARCEARACPPSGKLRPMRTRSTVKLVREGGFLARAPVALVEDGTAWSPYLTSADCRKLDAVRLALRRGDFAAAVRHGRVFQMKLIADYPLPEGEA
jgi:hypothetical protein